MTVNKNNQQNVRRRVRHDGQNQRRRDAFIRQKRIKPLAVNALQMRIVIVWLVFLGGIFGLVVRMLFLQIFDYGTLGRLASEQHQVNLRPYVPRRTIVDRNGNALAVDRVVYTLFAHPVGFHLPSEAIAAATPDQPTPDVYRYVAQKLAPIIDEAPEKLEADFRQQAIAKSSIVLSKKIDSNQASEIRRLKLDGLELVERFGRFYPQKDAVTEVLGFVDFDHVGKTGIEASQQEQIQREPLSLQLKRSGNGSLFPANLLIDAMKYDDWQLQLTIDLPLQRAAREALKKQMKAFNAKRGAVIVMDVHSGELLALTTEPTYDPSNYNKTDYALFKNWAVTDLYEPGSTFKPLNVALALDAGVITPNTTIYDPGSIVVGIHSIKNFDGGGNGMIDVAKILRVSSNVGMIKLMQNMKVADYYDKLLTLQLNKMTGIDLPGETPGSMKDRETFTRGKIEAATSAFGQGFNLTPIKLAQLHAALANGGTLVRPHLVKGLFNTAGEPQTVTPKYEIPRDADQVKASEEKQGTETGTNTGTETAIAPRIFSAGVAQTVVDMMETVVEDGSGKASRIDGYRIAGKTGTAQKADNGIYISGAYITSFVSIFPADKPRYVVMAVVDEPRAANSFGGTVAAPIVREVLKVLIARENIPPAAIAKEKPPEQPQ